jgi:hypothetical protein
MVAARTPADETRCRLRVIALSWLAHDFCSSNGDESNFDKVCWQDRFEACLINPLWAFVTLTSDRVSPRFIDDSLFFTETTCPGSKDDGFPVLSKPICRDLELRLSLSALWHERAVIQRNLFACFNHRSLFASMFVARFGEPEIRARVQAKLLEKIEWHKSHLRSYQDDDMHLWHQRWIYDLKQKLIDDSMEKDISKLKNEIETETFEWDQYNWLMEMECFKWVEESCPVLLHGKPDVMQSSPN